MPKHVLNVTTKDILFLFKSGKKDKQVDEVTFTGAAGNTGCIGSEGRFFSHTVQENSWFSRSKII